MIPDGEVYLIAASEGEGYKAEKLRYSHHTTALTVVDGYKRIYGMGSIRNIRYGIQNEGIGYQIFKTQGEFEDKPYTHIVGIATPEHVSELETIIENKRKKFLKKK